MADERATISTLYAFAFLATGSRGDANALVFVALRTSKRAGTGSALEVLTGIAARAIARASKPRRSFAELDDLLRQEPGPEFSQPVDEVVAWEVKRTCLAAVLGCLTATVRVTFLLTDVLGWEPGKAAALLEIEEGAYRVRLARARRAVEGFLGPRCQHVARGNPCSCRAAAPAWVESGAVDLPPEEDRPSGAHDAERCRDDVGHLYRLLPRARVGAGELESAVDSLRGDDE